MSFCEIKKEEKFKKLKTSPNEEIGHSSRAVCCCISHECNTFFFINLDGERQQGGEISLGTQKQHAIAETLNQQQQISEMLQEHSLTSSSDSTDSTDSTDSSDKSKTCHKSANQDTPGNFSHQPSSSNTNDSNNESLDYTYDCKPQQPRKLLGTEQEAIKTIPHDIHTIIDWLQINP
ncbi:hypothetical protein MJO28_008679 [Puccinia striiformis f. sp. tritici]|uniref:Uncharacterized protein n=1 Tax=Puccinia striiformis f. sp. tritici TaxID=168172 RepID=A0ACC0EBQ9_9BASI|nr:hypothetical protein MJO28_008679 [Puccinia striiformis f. sp. tritici]